MVLYRVFKYKNIQKYVEIHINGDILRKKKRERERA